MIVLYTDEKCENPRCHRINLPEEHLVTDDEQHFCDWFCHYEWQIVHGRSPSYEITNPWVLDP
jgi:hypothetical protein